MPFHQKKKYRKHASLSPGVCALCGIVSDDDYLGQLFTTPKIVAHENCLLFSPLLLQVLSPEENRDGYLIGFKIDDIEREVKRVMRLRCKVCHHIRAGVGCCNMSCRRSFHLSCGLNADAMGIFKDCFQFYCSDHAVSQDLKSRLSSCKKVVPECTICLSSIVDEGYEEFANIKRSGDSWSQFNEKIKERSIIHGQCCARCWLHRTCMRQYGLSAGLHHTKCPNCGDKDKFIEVVQQCGIWLPDRDASWELEPGAFQELYDNPDNVPVDEPLSECIDEQSYEVTSNQVEHVIDDHINTIISESAEQFIDLTISDDENDEHTSCAEVEPKNEPEDEILHSQRLPRKCTTKVKVKEPLLTSQILSRKRKLPKEWSSVLSPTEPIKRSRKSKTPNKEAILVKKNCSKCSKTIVTLNCISSSKNNNASLLMDSNRHENNVTNCAPNLMEVNGVYFVVLVDENNESFLVPYNDMSSGYATGESFEEVPSSNLQSSETHLSSLGVMRQDTSGHDFPRGSGEQQIYENFQPQDPHNSPHVETEYPINFSDDQQYCVNDDARRDLYATFPSDEQRTLVADYETSTFVVQNGMVKEDYQYMDPRILTGEIDYPCKARGRPRKTDIYDPFVSHTSEGTEDIVRQRGRPRIHPKRQEREIKLPRGRPRKYPKAEVVEKKAVGRPRKYLQEIENKLPKKRGRPSQYIQIALDILETPEQRGKQFLL